MKRTRKGDQSDPKVRWKYFISMVLLTGCEFVCNLSSLLPAQRDADADADIDADAGDDDKYDEEALTEDVSEAGGDTGGQQEAQAADANECSLSTSEVQEQPEEPAASENGQPEAENKENNNGINAEETQAIR